MGVPPEILRQVKLIELRTRGLVNSVFTGEYRSVFKGQGMEFSEVREYQPGDEVRSIDWNVTARMGRPFVKRFIEERELRSEEHTSELQSQSNIVCRHLLEK